MMRTGILTLTLAFFFASAGMTHAATISFGTIGSHSAGSTFTVPVYISADAGEAINAVGSTIVFPKDLVRVVSITDASLVNLWAEKPSFSNADGTAAFQGVIYNPGFSGTTGKIVSITFKALTSGAGQIEFKSPSILANDGAGTEILSSARPVSFTITEAARAATPPAPKAPSAAPVAPAVAPPLAPAPVPEVAPVQPLPEKTPAPVPIPQSLFWTVVAALMLPGFIFLCAIVLWLLWPRIVHLIHMFDNILSSRDQILQDELYVIHFTLTEELKRLRKERQERQLSMSERRIFMRFSTLQDRIEKLIGKQTRKDGQ